MTARPSPDTAARIAVMLRADVPVEEVIDYGTRERLWGINDVAAVCQALRKTGWDVPEHLPGCPLGYPDEVSSRGHAAHRRRGEPTCSVCRESMRMHGARKLGRPARHHPGETTHGTVAGARWHYRRGERPCYDCARADRFDVADRYAARARRRRAAS